MTTTTKKRESKLDTIERLITRKKGASQSDLTEATGWKPHSLTGGLSRVRKQGTLTIRTEKDAKRGTVFFGTTVADDTGGLVEG
jgi:Mn-dependent DtxR family transcriptional regulator